MDKSEILEILNDWNYWKRELPDTHSRELYDKKLLSFMQYSETVVIKGIRRSGKSTLMLNLIKNLLSQGVNIKNILFINLEDPRFINHLSTELLEKIKEVYLEYIDPDSKPYIFLDEIQNIPQWEKWVNREYELKKSHIVLSGSNSSLLSSEIASSLSGRYLQLDVYPLSFKEYLDFRSLPINNKLDLLSNKTQINRQFEGFLKYGAFPKVLEYNEDDKRELLLSYKDSIMLKDIVARYSLKEYKILEEIAAFLLANSGILQNVNKLKNNFHISYDMAESYLEYLIKAYMIFEVPKFDYSLKKQKANDKKYYSIDLGLSNIMRSPNLKTRGSDLENIVFLELVRRGYKLYYYKTSNHLECDFIVEKDRAIIQLIQVTKSLNDEKTKKRELRAFQKTIDELKLDSKIECLVLSEDKSSVVQFGDIQVNSMNIIEWLLDI